MSDLLTGMLWSNTLPDWQRDYYSTLLLETLRTKSIMVPYCAVKEDYAAANSGVVVYTEVYDTEPNTNPLTESDIWLKGAHLDSRTVRIELEIHGDILKFSDYNEIVQYVKAGNMRGLVRDKIGQNQIDYLDILARNAFLQHPNKMFMGQTSRGALTATDLFDPDIAETVRVHLEENEIPGVATVGDGDGAGDRLHDHPACHQRHPDRHDLQMAGAARVRRRRSQVPERSWLLERYPLREIQPPAPAQPRRCGHPDRPGWCCGCWLWCEVARRWCLHRRPVHFPALHLG